MMGPWTKLVALEVARSGWILDFLEELIGFSDQLDVGLGERGIQAAL